MFDTSTRDTDTSLTAFMRKREAASNAYIQSDAAPLAAIAATGDPATFSAERRALRRRERRKRCPQRRCRDVRSGKYRAF